MQEDEHSGQQMVGEEDISAEAEPCTSGRIEHISQDSEQAVDDVGDAETLQQMLQIRAKVALEKKAKADITFDILKHTLNYETSVSSAVEQKMKTSQELSEELKVALMVQNLKFDQLKNQVDLIMATKEVVQKHCQYDKDIEEEFWSKVKELDNMYKNFSELSKIEMEKIRVESNQNEAETKRLDEKEAEIDSKFQQEFNDKLKLLSESKLKNEKLVKTLEEQEKIKRDMRSRNENLRESIAVQTKVCEDAVEHKKKLYAEIELCTTRKETMQTEYTQTIAKLQSEVDIKTKTLEDLQRRRSNLELQVESHKEQNMKINKESQNLKRKHEELLNKLGDSELLVLEKQNELDDSVLQQNATVADMEKELHNVKHNYEVTQLKNEASAKEINEVAERVHSLTMTMGEKNRTLDALKKYLEDTKQRYDSALHERAELTGHVANLSSKLDANTEYLLSKQKEASIARSNFDARVSTLKEQLADITSKFNSQMNDIKLQCNGYTSNHNTQNQCMKNDHLVLLNKLQEQYDKAKAELETAKINNLSMEQMLSQKKKCKLDLMCKYELLQAENAEMQKRARDDPQQETSQKPVGILKSPGKFTVPVNPAKNVTFKPTISWETQSADSFDSIYMELMRTDDDVPQDDRDKLRVSPPVRLPKDADE